MKFVLESVDKGI